MYEKGALVAGLDRGDGATDAHPLRALPAAAAARRPVRREELVTPRPHPAAYPRGRGRG